MKFLGKILAVDDFHFCAFSFMPILIFSNSSKAFCNVCSLASFFFCCVSLLIGCIQQHHHLWPKKFLIFGQQHEMSIATRIMKPAMHAVLMRYGMAFPGWKASLVSCSLEGKMNSCSSTDLDGSGVVGLMIMIPVLSGKIFNSSKILTSSKFSELVAAGVENFAPFGRVILHELLNAASPIPEIFTTSSWNLGENTCPEHLTYNVVSCGTENMVLFPVM